MKVGRSLKIIVRQQMRRLRGTMRNVSRQTHQLAALVGVTVTNLGRVFQFGHLRGQSPYGFV
jgi:hypothetical protein